MLTCTDNNLNLLQDYVNVYRSMPPMPNIDHPSYLMPSTHPLVIAAISEEEEGDETDDDRTLAEVIKGNSMKTSKEGASSPSGDLLPSHPKKPRVTTRKHRESASLGGNDEETPR
jgi:hypothetical protein